MLTAIIITDFNILEKYFKAFTMDYLNFEWMGSFFQKHHLV